MHYISINKFSSAPLYSQLKDSIKRAIAEEILQPNDKIPTEEELCTAFNISRPVIRQAYSELISEGIIARYKGKGTFVKDKEIRSNFFSDLSNFNSEMIRAGLAPSTKVLIKEKITFDKKIYELLKLDPSQSVLHLKRLRYGDKIPLVIVDTYLPLNIFPDIEKIDLENESLYDVFEKHYKIYVSFAHRVVDAQIIDDASAKLLEVAKNTAVHHVETVASDQNERVLEVSVAIYPGERNQFDLTVYK